VPAATAEGATWVTRYGDGLDSRIALGNETAQPVTSTVEIDAGYLGEGAWLFSRHDGAALTNEVLPGGNARIAGIAHQPRRVALLRCRARVIPAPIGRTATVEVDDRLSTQTVTLRFQPPLAGGTRIEVATSRGYAPAGVQFDDGPTRQVARGPISLTTPEGGCARVRVFFGSKLFTATRAQIHDFPIAPEGGADATILLRDDASDAERLAAERLADAMHAYFACALDEPRRVELAIASGTAVRLAGAAIVIDGDGGRFARDFRSCLPEAAALPRVGVSDRVMHIVAESPEGALAATDALLRVLDEKYFWPGYMHGLTPNVAVGVLGRYIGDDGHFHGTPPEGMP